MSEEAWSRPESPPFPSVASVEMPPAAPVCCRLPYPPHSCSRTRYWRGKDCSHLCTAQIRKIAYIAPQNSDVGFGTEFAEDLFAEDFDEPRWLGRFWSGAMK